ncbi:MAG: tetratricopeptide repeat protein [Ignavibacterium sp.]|nr:tetratricopeptide repeat protein [Ignavibacterium sp.]
MKKYLINIFYLLIFLSSLAKADSNSIMQTANEYYKNNRYQLAIEEYNKLLLDGFAGTSLYYNLGNAHYRLGKVGYAILYYEKALKLSPNDEEVKHNLALAKLNLKDKVDTLPPFFIFNLWEGILAAFSVTGWTIIVYIIFILVLIVFVVYFFSRSVTEQRISFFTGIGLTVILLLTISLLIVKMNKEFNTKDGVIIETSVIVKSSPDYSSKDSFQIHEGLKVRIEDNVDDWVKIRLDDGKIGWITEKSLGII